MEEQSVIFGKEGSPLEGRYGASGGTRGAVISHPHPLMGGEMHNPVVEAVTRAFGASGIATLRFNFRGVGRSAGTYDEGRGEQDDLLAAVAFLEEQGIREVLLAGYSFGAWVTAQVLGRRDMPPGVLVAPPVGLMPFAFEALKGRVGLIVCGDQDQFCPAKEIRAVAEGLSCPLFIIPGATISSCRGSGSSPAPSRHSARLPVRRRARRGQDRTRVVPAAEAEAVASCCRRFFAGPLDIFRPCFAG